MVLFNYSTKEITAKIVYYGPGLCGKTTNLQFIYDNLPQPINKGKMLSLATTGIGVHETLRGATRLVLNSLKERYADRREERVEPAMQAAALAAAKQRPAASTPADEGKRPMAVSGPAAQTTQSIAITA